MCLATLASWSVESEKLLSCTGRCSQDSEVEDYETSLRVGLARESRQLSAPLVVSEQTS